MNTLLIWEKWHVAPAFLTNVIYGNILFLATTDKYILYHPCIKVCLIYFNPPPSPLSFVRLNFAQLPSEKSKPPLNYNVHILLYQAGHSCVFNKNIFWYCSLSFLYKLWLVWEGLTAYICHFTMLWVSRSLTSAPRFQYRADELPGSCSHLYLAPWLNCLNASLTQLLGYLLGLLDAFSRQPRCILGSPTWLPSWLICLHAFMATLLGYLLLCVACLIGFLAHVLGCFLSLSTRLPSWPLLCLLGSSVSMPSLLICLDAFMVHLFGYLLGLSAWMP